MSCDLNPNVEGNSLQRGFVLPLHQRQWGEAGEEQSREEQSHRRFGAAGGGVIRAPLVLLTHCRSQNCPGEPLMWRGAGWGRAVWRDQIQVVIFSFRSEHGLGLKGP